MRTNTSQALFLGVAIGFTFAVLPSSCGKGPVVVRCSASNCEGCCDDTGACFKGISTEACGSLGASCAVCAGGQMCARLDQNSEFGGRCTGGTTGGGTGGGSTGGGTGGGSTGGGTGGGSTGGGGGTTDGGTCNANNCATGCCTAQGVCITTTTPSRCGTGGAACGSCMLGNTCVSGTCTPCAGCVDINTGACQGGMSNTQCGKNGSFCQACDMQAGQTCQGGTCFGGTSCNASTCTGCCDGNNCVMPSSYTNAQCGQGANGAACISCIGGATCDSADAGACVGGGGTGGGGGGFPGLDGGGFPSICDSSTPCGSGQCCDSLGGAFGLCINTGDSCAFGGTNPVCLFTSCKCKSSGACAP